MKCKSGGLEVWFESEVSHISRVGSLVVSLGILVGDNTG